MELVTLTQPVMVVLNIILSMITFKEDEIVTLFSFVCYVLTPEVGKPALKLHTFRHALDLCTCTPVLLGCNLHVTEMFLGH